MSASPDPTRITGVVRNPRHAADERNVDDVVADLTPTRRQYTDENGRRVEGYFVDGRCVATIHAYDDVSGRRARGAVTHLVEGDVGGPREHHSHPDARVDAVFRAGVVAAWEYLV